MVSWPYLFRFSSYGPEKALAGRFFALQSLLLLAELDAASAPPKPVPLAGMPSKISSLPTATACPLGSAICCLLSHRLGLFLRQMLLTFFSSFHSVQRLCQFSLPQLLERDCFSARMRFTSCPLLHASTKLHPTQLTRFNDLVT